MRQKLFIAIIAILWVPMGLMGQTYSELWKQVRDAQEIDLPQTAIGVLAKIETKAMKEQAYGQLMKSALLSAKLQAEVAPDSMLNAVERLEAREQTAQDKGLTALAAVYDAVLAKVYQENHQITDDWEQRANHYRALAKAHPEALAAVKAQGYEPFVVKGDDSSLYGHDLLSVIGSELDEWAWLTDYYTKSGNRPAACLTALNEWRIENGELRIVQLDSLIALYGDLPECGEVAMERYERMSDDRYTSAQKAEWLQTAINRWGSWRRANMLKNAWSALINPQYTVEAPENVREVNKAQTVKLTGLRHLQSLTMKVWRTTLAGDTNLNPNSDKDYKKIKSGAQELKDKERTLTFTGHEDYELYEDSLELAALPAGVYLLEFASQPQTDVSRMLYFVSGVRMLSQPQPDNTMRYVVVDATSGQPLKGATIRMTFRGHEEKTLTTDANGEVVYDNSKQRPTELYVYTATDNCCPKQNAFGRYMYYEHQYNRETCNVFTDRSIYRPGQTVHVAAIIWKEVSATENVAVEGKSVRLELRDTNYKLVGEQQATTDRFGKCSAQFTLPTGLLNGRFSVRVANSMASIRVEEYKRPAFQVEFDEYKDAYSQGDIVQAKAKAMSYAGVPVQGAKVKYTVRRQIAWWWLNYSWYWQRGWMGESIKDETLKEGEAVTADDGTFMVDVPLLLPKGQTATPMYYHFVVEADVTDMAGETHRGTMRLPLGSKATALTCDLPEQVRSDQMPKVTFTRRNAAGKEIEGTVKYRIQKQEAGGKKQEVSGKWQQAKANCQLSIVNSPLKSGSYRLEAVCGDDSIKTTFVVFGLADTKPATKTDDWFYISDQQFPNDGKPVTVQVGASDPNMHIVYSIFTGNKMLESGNVKKNGELVNRQFTYKEEYGDGLLLTYAWVKDGKSHMHQQAISRPMPDKQLKLTWTTFRDRLTPGQQEEWSLHVTKPDGSPADATLMAVLYDKSLDQLNPHQWSFTPSAYLSLPSTGWQWTSWGQLRGSGALDYQRLSVPDFSYSHFDQEVLPRYISMMRIRGGGKMYASRAIGAMDGMVMAEAAPMMNAVVQKAVVVEEKATADAIGTADTGAADETTESQTAEASVRENLNETAFCYPAVESDPEGNIVLKFTLPESLTTWRFMGVANTVDMLYGQIGGEAVAQKDVMIQPNMPRFVRMGDEAELSARIFNLLEKPVSGTAKMQLIDPETNKVVYEQQQPFSVEGGKTTTVHSPFSILHSQFSLLICKVTAQGEGFSDGEQHYLPILPNREMVTKTVAYTQHEPGVKTIDLTKLFPTGTDQQKLTIEYTNNPAWLMVQSLPTLGQPWEHSAIDQAASYYSNQLARTLLKQSPQVKTVFEQWKREEQSPASTLHSQLEKNQELKDIVLNETPWVWAADRETEQKQRLSDFFDENGISNRLATAVEKLKKLQNGDGSFSWYPGMEGSEMITASVAEMLVRLNIMTGEQKDIQQLYNQAFGYLGRETVKLVKDMKKREKKGEKPSFPSFTTLRWLYICALDGRSLPQDVKAANDYLLPLLKKDIKRQTIYEKAMTAVVLAQRGDQKTAANYVKSLKEYTVYTEEMGRYYDAPRATYSWFDYKIPTEVAALEAIQRVTPQDRQTVDEMRRWLLQEKRTQMWDTPISSVNAIYAFLFDHHHLLANKEQTVLAIDGTPVETPKATASIGYVKTAITQPHGTTFTATKTSEDTSWGAVYAQFMQKTSDVEASQSGITVKREIVAKNNSPFSILQSPLAVGDRIKVRIVIETQRDLDFVQVSDRRAACMEPINQLSGYHHGAYCSPKDNATHYFFYGLAKGKHVVETEYYIDRAGTYETGTCTVGCAYAPEYRATAPSMTLKVKE